MFYRSWMVAAVMCGLGVCSSASWGKTLRVVSYNIDCADQSSDNNITDATHSLPTVIQGIGFHHIGTNAQPVDVLGVEELTAWTNIGSGTTDTNGSLLFQDTNVIGFSSRFYRAKWPFP